MKILLIDTGYYNVDKEDGIFMQSPLKMHPSSNWTLAEKVTAFCETTNDVERIRLAEIIQTQLNSLSTDVFNCTICPAEERLRRFLLQNDTFKVIQGIGTYASILTVMLQHGLQPQLTDEETMIVSLTIPHLLLRLKKVVEPQQFFPMSSVRRDIETVIKMLSAFKEEKITKATKLIADVKKNSKTEMVKKYIQMYLEGKSWTQHYLMISWLKNQVNLPCSQWTIPVFG